MNIRLRRINELRSESNFISQIRDNKNRHSQKSFKESFRACRGVNQEQRHIERGSQDKDTTNEQKHATKREELVLVCILECQRVVVLEFEGFAHLPVGDADRDVGKEVHRS